MAYATDMHGNFAQYFFCSADVFVAPVVRNATINSPSSQVSNSRHTARQCEPSAVHPADSRPSGARFLCGFLSSIINADSSVNRGSFLASVRRDGGEGGLGPAGQVARTADRPGAGRPGNPAQAVVRRPAIPHGYYSVES